MYLQNKYLNFLFNQNQLQICILNLSRTLPVIVFEPKVTLKTSAKRVDIIDSIPISWQINSKAIPMDLKICFNTQQGNIASMFENYQPVPKLHIKYYMKWK